MRTTIGEPDGEQWLQVDRLADDEVRITYLEGVATCDWMYLPGTLAEDLGRALAHYEPVRTEYRAVYPAQLTPDSPLTTRVLEDEEEAEGLVTFMNRRLARWGLPEVARVESRQLFGTEWTHDE